MPATDPRVDAYIKAAPSFAKPILEHFRAIVHAACPDAVETIKWSTPSWEYHGPLCSMAAFKAFPPSHRREYVEWLTGAKKEETRQRRLETAIAQIAEGKSQNWKYM